ncbi:MAG: pilus assembly PilX N-terminal domain-containing protein [Thermodesulfovibrionales bacterium]|nr:pilus assembly PilX N-terminal domain-containing protein [Thermodesulfovibrionales bacterium]
MIKCLCKESGLSIIAVILGLLILSVFGAAAVSIISTQANISLQEEQGLQAFYIAEGGLQYALANRTYCNYNTLSFDLGEGSFFVNAVFSNAVLSGNISNTATTVYLTLPPPLMGFTNSGFTIPGTVGIDSEYLFCTGSISNSFVGCTRNYLGSGFANHISGAAVTQCAARSTGTVSKGLLSGSVKRVTQINVGQ